jgi:SulP family sulfate permease
MTAVRTELVAALTAVALLAPETVAFALIAGVPPERGLAAAPLCVLAYALLGRSPRIIVGATAATAVICAATPGSPDRVVALTLMAGAILLVTGLLRAGFTARFLAPEALRGFLFGLAVVIVVRQAAVLVDVPTRTGDVFVRIRDILAAVPRWNLEALITGLVALVALIVLERWLPRVPATLIVLLAAGVATATLHLQPHVATVSTAVPGLHLPRLGGHDWLALAPTAAGLALIVFALGHGVAGRLPTGDAPPDADREMTGLGVANLVAGLAGGVAVTASPSASSAAAEAGGRTRVVPVASAALLAVVALTLTPAFAFLPEPVLAAVVIMAVRPFLSLTPLLVYLRRDRRAFAVAASAALGVMFLTLIPGLLVAVALSLVIFVADASRLRVSRLGRSRDGAYLAVEQFDDLAGTPGVTILRPDGPLFFANVARLAEAVDAELARGAGTTIVLDLTASFDLGLDVLDELAAIRRRVQAHGRRIAFAHLYLGAREAIGVSPLADVPTYATLDAAVTAS